MAEKTTGQYLRSINVNEKLVTSLDNGIIILDNELQILYYNKWLELHTSIKEKDILGLNIFNVFSNIKIKTLQRKIRTALRMGTPTFYTATVTSYLIPIKINQIKVSSFEHMRQDVSIIPFDTEKNLVALIITDQTNMTNTHNLLESNIQKVQELNKELLKEKETIDERVILMKIDTKHIIKEISQAYKKLLGFDDEDVLGTNLFKYEILTLTGDLKKDLLYHMKIKKVLKYEKINISQKGKEVWLVNTLVPEYDQNANHIGFIIFSDNITSSKLNQKHQAKLLENSRTAAMGEMISMIAHQWRQPLTVINTIIATLKIKKELNILPDSLIKESYTKIESTIDYLSETIDDFRNFFKKNKELRTISLKNILDKSNSLLLSEFEVLNIKYIENVEKDLEITTYQNELIQTMINIIKNSVDAFRENPQDEQILSITAFQTQTHISLEIEDNAGGISPPILKQVFEPYFSTKSKNGTGLGLYVCKTIIEEHLRGKITMRSSNNRTKTIIELPKALIIKEEV